VANVVSCKLPKIVGNKRTWGRECGVIVFAIVVWADQDIACGIRPPSLVHAPDPKPVPK
jgi:hypothetical protein